MAFLGFVCVLPGAFLITVGCFRGKKRTDDEGKPKKFKRFWLLCSLGGHIFSGRINRSDGKKLNVYSSSTTVTLENIAFGFLKYFCFEN